MSSKFKIVVKKGCGQQKNPRKKVSEYRKNGVRKISSDDELLEAFGVSDNLCGDLDVENQISEPKKREAQDVKENKIFPPKNVDKNGLPVLDDAGDISILIRQKNEEDIDVQKSGSEGVKKKAARGKDLKNRHGIPILQNDTDYSSIFHDGEPVEDFNEILVESLGDKSAEVLLNEKRDKMKPVKQITEKKRLSRYPLPQGQLDLHGYTAIKADLNVELYLRNAFRNGTYTVRVIVGKGIHSEDGPVLPDVIEKRVNQMKNEKIVLAYEWDKKKKSKSGSLIIYLNNYHNC